METAHKGYTPTIGIEIHAELQTKTKMFCNSKNEPHASKPNEHVCPVCMGHPGTLPKVNMEAVRHVVRVGLAVKGEIAHYTEFDRKNYFYPDIPKGYQISQYEYPLVKGGTLANVALTRIHLEEDTARSQHDQGEGSLVDFNRAGVPLMELVTEPVIHDAKTAGNFARELQLLLRTLGASSANMEKGEMRVEANISVSKTETFGTKVEVKNLNSFKSVESAISYEINRQIELLEQGGKVVQETRGWDEVKSKTYSQRLKESADDYRYFPDPDIPKFNIRLSKDVSLPQIADSMPILPKEKREKYRDIGIPSEQCELIISEKSLDTFFSRFMSLDSSPEIIKLGANYLTSDILALISAGHSIDNASPEHLRGLLLLIDQKLITSRVAKDLLFEVVFQHIEAKKLATERKLIQESDSTTIREFVRSVIEKNQNVVLEYKNGKEASLQFLIGQGMKLSRGTANPQLLKSLFVEELAKDK